MSRQVELHLTPADTETFCPIFVYIGSRCGRIEM